MALIATKCTQCSADITVDDGKKSGRCEFCGTDFITQDVINHYNVNIVQGDVHNLLNLAQKSIEAGKGIEALERINKALEIEPTLSIAWQLKANALPITLGVNDYKEDEIILSGRYAIEYAKEDEKDTVIKDVYALYLMATKHLLEVAKLLMENMKRLQDDRSGNVWTLKEESQRDLERILPYFNIIDSAIKLINTIPTDYMMESAELQNKVVECVEIYKEFIAFFEKRRDFVGQRVLEIGHKDIIRKQFDEMIEKLPEDIKSTIEPPIPPEEPKIELTKEEQVKERKKANLTCGVIIFIMIIIIALIVFFFW